MAAVTPPPPLHPAAASSSASLAAEASSSFLRPPPPPQRLLLEWAKEKGASDRQQAQRRHHGEAATGLRGVVATRPVRAKEPFPAVPRCSSCRRGGKLGGVRSGIIPPALYDEADEKYASPSASLLCAPPMRPRPRWSPSWSCLPEQGDFDMPAVGRSDQQLDRLACPPIVANAKRRRRRREDIVRALTASGCNEGDILWALDIVNRAHWAASLKRRRRACARGGERSVGRCGRPRRGRLLASWPAPPRQQQQQQQQQQRRGDGDGDGGSAVVARGVPAAFAAALVGGHEGRDRLNSLRTVNHASSARRPLRYDLFSDRLSSTLMRPSRLGRKHDSATEAPEASATTD